MSTNMCQLAKRHAAREPQLTSTVSPSSWTIKRDGSHPRRLRDNFYYPHIRRITSCDTLHLLFPKFDRVILRLNVVLLF